MKKQPFYQLWSALRCSTMECRQQAGRSLVLRQIDDINAAAAKYNEGADTLVLNPDAQIPDYVSVVDTHCMPGSYHTSVVEGDVSAGGL